MLLNAPARWASGPVLRPGRSQVPQVLTGLPATCGHGEVFPGSRCVPSVIWVSLGLLDPLFPPSPLGSPGLFLAVWPMPIGRLTSDPLVAVSEVWPPGRNLRPRRRFILPSNPIPDLAPCGRQNCVWDALLSGTRPKLKSNALAAPSWQRLRRHALLRNSAPEISRNPADATFPDCLPTTGGVAKTARARIGPCQGQ